MAEGLFATGLSEPSAAGATVVAPVQGFDYRSAIGAVSDLAGLFGKDQEKKRKEAAEERKNSTVGTFYQAHDQLERLKQAGSINDKEYSVRSQALVRHYGATFPEYQDEIAKAATSLKGFGGLGDVQDTVQYQKTEERNRITDAQKMGFDVKIDDSPEYKASVIKQHSDLLRIQREAEERRKLRAEAREETTFQRTESEYREKKKASAAVQALGESGLSVIHALANQLEMEAKKPGADIAALTARWDNQIVNFKANISAAAKEYGETGAGWNSVLDRFDTTFKERLSGKVTSEFAKNQYGYLLDSAGVGILRDPEAATGYAMLRAAPNSLAALMQYTKDDNVLRKMFGIMTQPNKSVDMTGKEDVKVLRQTYEKISSDPDIDPQEKSVLRGNITNSLLKGLGSAMITGSNPDSVENAIKLISSPLFVEDLKNKNISQPAYQAAKQAVNALYNDPVTMQITDKLDKPLTVFGGGRTALEVFDIKVDDRGVSLSPKMAFFFSPDLMMASQSLGKAERALSNLVIANAHLSGTTNYKQYWEDNKQSLFPNIYGDPSKLKVGDVINGKKFLGGPYKLKDSWEDVGERSSEGIIGGKPTSKNNVSTGKIGQ